MSSCEGSCIAAISGCLNIAFESILIFASKQCKFPPVVITSGFISNRLKSQLIKRFIKLGNILENCLVCVLSNPRTFEIFLA